MAADKVTEQSKDTIAPFANLIRVVKLKEGFGLDIFDGSSNQILLQCVRLKLIGWLEEYLEHGTVKNVCLNNAALSLCRKVIFIQLM